MPGLLKTPWGSLLGLRNAPGVPHGAKERPWVPSFDQKNRQVSGFTLSIQVSVFDFELNARTRTNAMRGQGEHSFAR